MVHKFICIIIISYSVTQLKTVISTKNIFNIQKAKLYTHTKYCP
uniref:Uncharacterized protein n=1 Tax=Anguilla anguilla TaxID=7936 RepID=A0A0E9RUP2_ANGAN